SSGQERADASHRDDRLRDRSLGRARNADGRFDGEAESGRRARAARYEPRLDQPRDPTRARRLHPRRRETARDRPSRHGWRDRPLGISVRDFMEVAMLKIAAPFLGLSLILSWQSTPAAEAIEMGGLQGAVRDEDRKPG